MSNTVKRALPKGNKYCKVWDGVILAWDVFNFTISDPD